ncbi:hypothetical protein L7F22_004621 [Adiantum nelumboides]|nr:hypothetical protein [Adiantum nelumboides]
MACSKLLLHHHTHQQQSFCTSGPPQYTSNGPRALYLATCRAPANPNDRQMYPSNHPSISISRPVVILPGLGNNSNDYIELVSSLKRRGLNATVAEVSRPDWLNNAKCFLDKRCWSGKLSPRPLLDWYFERMKKAIIAAKLAVGGDTKVSLLAHSAGGWLARVYMLEYGIDDISLLLSLGTPHLPPPKGVPGVVDQTRGLLDYLNKACPGDCFAPDVKYICIAGRFLKGERIFSSEVPAIATTGVGTIVATNKHRIRAAAKLRRLDGNTKQWAATLQACLVGQSYKQVCGQADVWGDGVVPEISAHLHGARNITLNGVYHSMLGARHPDRPWYGSPGVLEQWVHFLE